MFKSLLKLALLGCGLWFSSAQAEDLKPLPAEQAFVFSAYFQSPSKLIAEWQMAPGVYLYRKKLHFSPQTALGPVVLPPAQKISLSLSQGLPTKSFEAYQGKLRVVLPLKHKKKQNFSIKVSYQGCSQEGYCYAPMQKELQISYPFSKEGLDQAPLVTISEVDSQGKALSTGASNQLLTNQIAVKNFLSAHSTFLTLLCFLGLGLLLAFTPCSLPMIPILSSIIVGHKKGSSLQTFYLSLSYVLGLALTYALLGLSLAWLGSNLQSYFQNLWIITLFSVVLLILALGMLGLFELRLPRKWQHSIHRWQDRHRGGSYFAVFLMGALSTLIVSPCVTAPLVGVLAYVTDSGNLLLGASALFALGLGMGLPLLMIGASAGKYLPRSGPWMEAIKKTFAFLLLGLALWLLSRFFPAGLILFLSAALLLAMAVYLFFVLEAFTPFWRYLAYLCGALLAVYSLALFVGVSLGQSSFFYVFESATQQSKPESASFILVKDMQQLNTLLQQAKAEKKPVVLDFYAEWCESCREIEKRVLSAPEVQAALQPFLLLRANVTENNSFDRALLKRYNVVAPPTFLFFNWQGQELMEKRIIGEVDSKTFLTSAKSL